VANIEFWFITCGVTTDGELNVTEDVCPETGNWTVFELFAVAATAAAILFIVLGDAVILVVVVV
jgi:hypothetical protein